MSGLGLTINNHRFEHVAECHHAARVVRIAKQAEGTSRIQVISSLFLATLINTINTVYYTASSIGGTCKRFPTQGKEASKKFLIKEGMRAYHSAVFCAATLLFTLTAIVKPTWTLSHIDIDPCGGKDDGLDIQTLLTAYNSKIQSAHCDVQLEAVTIREAFLAEQKNEGDPTLNNGTDYFKEFCSWYEPHKNLHDLQKMVTGMKKVVTAIRFIRSSQPLPSGLFDADEGATLNLFKPQSASPEQEPSPLDKAKIEEDRAILDEQKKAYEKSLKVDQARDSMDATLKGLREQKESLAQLKGDCVELWQKANHRGIAKYTELPDEKLPGFIDKLKKLDFSGVNLEPVKEPTVPQVLILEFEPMIEVLKKFDEFNNGITKEAFDLVTRKFAEANRVTRLEGKEGISEKIVEEKKAYMRKCEGHSDIIDIQGRDMMIRSKQTRLIQFISNRDELDQLTKEIDELVKIVSRCKKLLELREKYTVGEETKCGEALKAYLSVRGAI